MAESKESMISAKGIWKVFGANPEGVLQSIKPGQTREEIKQVTGHVVAVKDVSFEVEKGECFVVMGLSGSGKSTLLRTLTRLIEPTIGTIEIDGSDVRKLSRKELLRLRRDKVAMVFQHFGLFPHYTVMENIAYGLEISGVKSKERMERSEAMLELVGLEGWGECFPRELSGGMQQRVGLARAMVMNTDILFFDEPFSALDPLIRREMQDELIQLQRQLHKTMVFITHDFLEAIKLGDRIAILRDGELIQAGTPEDIVASPVNDYVRDFAEDVPRYKVFSVKKIMRKTAKGAKPEGEPVLETAKIDEVFERVATSDATIPVADAKGAIIGEVDRGLVMRAMQS